MKHTGWRKPTPGLGFAEMLAQAGERASVPKSQALLALKRVGAHIGLKPSDMMLLDTLAAFTQAQDWSEGRRPIVWASNAYLMERTGFSLSALKRHVRRLAEFGVISFKDSPNGKRWGRRTQDGVIIEAYGFDLSPLSARAGEFEDLHRQLQTERDLCKRLKRQITIARRMIWARIETAVGSPMTGPWTQFSSHFTKLLALLPKRAVTSEKLEQLLNLFRALLHRIETFCHAANDAADDVENTHDMTGETSQEPQETAPMEANFDPHIQATNQLDNVTSMPKKSIGPSLSSVAPSASEGDLQAVVQRTGPGCKHLDLRTIMHACPEFASWARNVGGYLKDWNDLHRIAGLLRPMIGISEKIWNWAQSHMGQQKATSAFALVFEKHATGQIASPNGYLRGMVKKERAGELHLDRSFHGRLKGQVA